MLDAHVIEFEQISGFEGAKNTHGSTGVDVEARDGKLQIPVTMALQWGEKLHNATS